MFVREYIPKNDMLLKKPLGDNWPYKMIFERDTHGHRKKELKKTLQLIWDNIPLASLSLSLSQSLSTCGLTGLGAELFLLLNCRSSSWVGRCLTKQYNGGQMPHKTSQCKYATFQENIALPCIATLCSVYGQLVLN